MLWRCNRPSPPLPRNAPRVIVLRGRAALPSSRSRPVPAHSGLAVDLLSRLPVARFKEDASHDSCSICLDDFAAGVRVYALPCSHVFHEDCLDTWFREHSDCPLCKRDYNRSPPPMPEAVEVEEAAADDAAEQLDAGRADADEQRADGSSGSRDVELGL
eukprot:PLAT7091.5.p2 GENE.PLAT7091.5~~PLAT7091.5.p2  ORF type:complete len:159 (+),score=47.69 PLAT7091.5:249-725(+)